MVLVRTKHGPKVMLNEIRDMLGWTFVSADLRMPWKQQKLLVPKSLGEKFSYLTRNETLIGFLAFFLRIFVGPWGITCFFPTNLGEYLLGVGSTSGRICHQACATPCHGEVLIEGVVWLVVPCWMHLFHGNLRGHDTPEIRPWKSVEHCNFLYFLAGVGIGGYP